MNWRVATFKFRILKKKETPAALQEMQRARYFILVLSTREYTDYLSLDIYSFQP